jgi:hypothetical protein
MPLRPNAFRLRAMPGLARLGIAVFLLVASLSPVWADIGGGTGNAPISNKDWPAGAEAIFNFKGRVAFWDGPPLGGGQWHAECRGYAKQLNEVLTALDRMDSKNKRVVVHDGPGQSFWLNPSRDATKAEAARIDWTFIVWSKPSWQRLVDRKKARDQDAAPLDPPSQIDVYTGGVKWADVVVPKGLTIVDQRK